MERRGGGEEENREEPRKINHQKRKVVTKMNVHLAFIKINNFTSLKKYCIRLSSLYIHFLVLKVSNIKLEKFSYTQVVAHPSERTKLTDPEEVE